MSVVLPIVGNLATWHIVHMDREQIIAKLRKHATELKAAGVVHLFLHRQPEIQKNRGKSAEVVGTFPLVREVSDLQLNF